MILGVFNNVDSFRLKNAKKCRVSKHSISLCQQIMFQTGRVKANLHRLKTHLGKSKEKVYWKTETLEHKEVEAEDFNHSPCNQVSILFCYPSKSAYRSIYIITQYIWIKIFIAYFIGTRSISFLSAGNII